ncbi:MAG: hypothetical protein WCA35_24110 [Kovacikia sp.]
MIQILVNISQFDQCVLNISLINLCNQSSYGGQAIRRQHNSWQDEEQPTRDPWHDLHQLMVYIPHPEQQYEGVTLESGLTRGYNIEAKAVIDRSRVPYKIPKGGQFVVVMKQKGLDGNFEIAATGIFVRPLALLRLDFIVDRIQPEYQPMIVKHPIIRDYPSNWETQLNGFLQQEIGYEALPDLVASVDQTLNPDYRPPSWHEVRLAAQGFAGV